MCKSLGFAEAFFFFTFWSFLIIKWLMSLIQVTLKMVYDTISWFSVDFTYSVWWDRKAVELSVRKETACVLAHLSTQSLNIYWVFSMF